MTDQSRGSDLEPPRPGRTKRRVWQVLATAAGRVVALGIVAVGLSLGLLAALFIALGPSWTPNPFIADHPNDWGEFSIWAGELLVLVGGAAACAFGGVAALFGRLAWRKLGAFVGLPLLVVVGMIGISLLVHRDEIAVAPDCSDLSLDGWRSLDERTRQRTAIGIVRCGTFTGKTDAALFAALGRRPDWPESAPHMGASSPLVDFEMDERTHRVVRGHVNAVVDAGLDIYE